jgi:hypothetical protein
MSAQNLVSAVLADETRQGILQKLTEIRQSLDFLVTLDAEQARSLFKAGNGYSPFIEQAATVAQEHPEILPSVFQAAEFDKDVKLIAALLPIQVKVNDLADGIRDTLMAANSDALAQSLEIYAAVKQHKDKVVGLESASDNLGLFFQRARRKQPVAAEPAAAVVH